MGRIKTATPKSRIAVFRADMEGVLDAGFADTTEGLRRIKNDGGLVGAFDGTMDQETVYPKLRDAAWC